MGEKKVGQWDYRGECDPLKQGAGQWATSIGTFSLGVFQWLPKSSGKGLKRGKVVRRIKGFASFPEEAHAEAQAIVDDLNGKRKG